MAFGAGGGSGFSFSSSFDTGTSSSNPFANMNGGGSTQPSGGPGFGGFKGSIFNIPPANQTQNQQPATSPALFGAQSQQNGTGNVFGGFGNNTSITSASPFQSTPSTASSTAGLFSQSAPAPASGPFGQTNAAKPTVFENSTAFSATSDSMQTSPDAKAGAGKPLLGTGATSQPPPAFGAFGGSSSKPLFGATATETKTPFSTAQTSQSLFSTKPAESSASTTTTAGGSIFGRISQPETSTAATTSVPASAPVAATSSASTPTLFGTNMSTGVSAPTFQPFQSSSNLFSGIPKPVTTQPAPAPSGLFSFNRPVETKTEEPKAPITTTVTEPKKDENVPKPSGGLFSSTPSFGQPPATNIFAPKPASTADQAPPAQTTGAKPFAGLFSMKPAAPSSLAQDKPPASPFQPSNIFAPKPEVTAGDSVPAPKRTAGPEGDTSVSKRPSLFATAPSTFLTPSTSATSTSSVTTNGPGLFGIKGAASTTTTSSNVPASKPDSIVLKAQPLGVSFSAKGPRGLPSNLNKELSDDVELLYRVRMLNESFKRKISELDPSKDDFDVVISFYLRVRETIGAPILDAQSTASKRKLRDEEHVETEIPTQKKAKPADELTDQSKPTPATGLFSSSPFKPVASSDSLVSNKRKAAADTVSSTLSGAQPEKRASTTQASGSTTASIFASSFSGSKDSKVTADAKASEASNASPTPAFKPLFPPSGTSASSLTQSLFSLKPSTEKAKESPVKAAFEVPKFGSGTATNFLSQFKQQASKDAEKEKEKRKAEDFDSDEDDEAEWERKDAEEQRKKRENFEALAKKRAKFVPGKGFVFEDDEGKEESVESPQPSKTISAPALPPTSASIFQNSGSRSPPKSANIFGHLSAANSEAEGEEDDSDKESTDGDVNAEAEPRLLPAPSTEGSGDSSDDGDISKALKKKSEEASAAKKDALGGTTPLTAPTPQSGRSLFDRIQYDQDGKPKRDAQPLEGNKESATNGSTLFGNHKTAPSFNASSSGSPLFSPSTQNISGQDNASTPKAGSIFGSSLNTSGGLFGSPTSAAPAASTTTSASDHTWKIDSPIKFASTTSGSESSSGTATNGASKPFSTLFGGSITQKSTATSNGGSQLGFVFGGPTQGTSSLFPSSTGGSATPSGATTPAAASDTGADDSADGDAAPAEPQVDLARSRAGEEEEDMLLETRARALKLEPGSGWQSQGVGWLRILKHKTTSRSRVILRADPSGKVILNASLLPQIKYKEAGTSVQFLVPRAEGTPEQWAIRVKKEEVSRLATTMEEAKA